MDVSLTLIVIMAVLFAAGVYAMLERSLTRVLIGFLLLGNATNLLLLIVMGVPGVAPFSDSEGAMSDPLPQALTLTAIVITFAITAFLLALIYRSWQLGQADTVEDDEADIALRERTDADEEALEDEGDEEDEEATTDFLGEQAAPIIVLHGRDNPAIHDDAPVDMPLSASFPEPDIRAEGPEGGERESAAVDTERPPTRREARESAEPERDGQNDAERKEGDV